MAEMVSTDAKLADFVNRLKEFTARNLESVVLYGSAARGNFLEGHSDLNVLCVLRSLHVEELSRVAGVVKWWCGDLREPAPLFFTRDELKHAAEIFPIEMLDMKRNRRVLFGADVIADIEVPMNLHRVQIEHELSTTLLKLRQHYLRAPGNSTELAPVMRKSFSGVLTLLRHVLIAFGQEPPEAAHDIVVRTATTTGADLAAFEPLLKLRETGEFHGEIVPVYGAYLKALERTLDGLERHFPKREWQRVKNASS